MTDILLISGSPAQPSRSWALLAYCADWLAAQGLATQRLAVRDLDAAELLFAQPGPSLRPVFDQVAAARGIVLATPVYKAAYTGILKALLDVLPAGAFSGKIVLPLVSGASPAHSLAVDYALKPVLFALGAAVIPAGVYVTDGQYERDAAGSVRFTDSAAETGLHHTLALFARLLPAL
ncbi:MAG: NADPH-dependent FMN reductase [Anaerolineae bacterium]|jgi:FMN reductase|nr:NADPH-dependent FMN reductase [Anaerolineae bacterium]